MNLKDNITYLKKSISNKEKLDIRYMSLELHNSLDDMVRVTKDIKEILIAIKRLNMSQMPSDKFYKELMPLVISDLGSKNEFNGFINACDSAISTIVSNPETFKEIVDLYLEHRDISEYTPREWIQAVIDKGSQRSLGVIGQNKVIDLAVQAGFRHTNNNDAFFRNEYSVSVFSKNLAEKINPRLNFGSQNKDLDVVFKVNTNYFFLEAKHIKEAGGAQDKQIKELIGLLSVKLPSNIYIISFMDGVYSNKLLEISDSVIENPDGLNYGGKLPKIKTQRYELLTGLKNNKNSFWVNTEGLKTLFSDLLKK